MFMQDIVRGDVLADVRFVAILKVLVCRVVRRDNACFDFHFWQYDQKQVPRHVICWLVTQVKKDDMTEPNSNSAAGGVQNIYFELEITQFISKAIRSDDCLIGEIYKFFGTNISSNKPTEEFTPDNLMCFFRCIKPTVVPAPPITKTLELPWVEGARFEYGARAPDYHKQIYHFQPATWTQPDRIPERIEDVGRMAINQILDPYFAGEGAVGSKFHLSLKFPLSFLG